GVGRAPRPRGGDGPGAGKREEPASAFTGATHVRDDHRPAGAAVRLAGWVRSDPVGMESTGCYWKTVFYALEDRFDCWLVNAKHLRNIPGRKSDVIDSRWCCELVELGLVRPSFVPPPEIRPTARPDPAPVDSGAGA